MDKELSAAIAALAEAVNENQQENQDKIESENDDMSDAGFKTTIGDILHQSQSTPKKPTINLFASLEKIDEFTSTEKYLCRKLDEIEKFMRDGLKKRAEIVLKYFKQIWTKWDSDLDIVCAVAGEREK